VLHANIYVNTYTSGAKMSYAWGPGISQHSVLDVFLILFSFSHFTYLCNQMDMSQSATLYLIIIVFNLHCNLN